MLKKEDETSEPICNSKWETAKGYPDITLIEPLADILGISVIELMSGNDVINSNKAFRMDRMKFYVCPVCGNVICSTGEIYDKPDEKNLLLLQSPRSV